METLSWNCLETIACDWYSNLSPYCLINHQNSARLQGTRSGHYTPDLIYKLLVQFITSKTHPLSSTKNRFFNMLWQGFASFFHKSQSSPLCHPLSLDSVSANHFVSITTPAFRFLPMTIDNYKVTLWWCCTC